jgi:hypothetical protein
MLDAATPIECLEFIRAAIASNDRQTALDIKNVLAEVCQKGYADRTAIWSDLTETEKQQFQKLLGPPPLVREFGQRIRDAIGYQSPAVASAIQTDLNRALDAGQLTAADVVGVVGDRQFLDFKELVARCRRPTKNLANCCVS